MAGKWAISRRIIMHSKKRQRISAIIIAIIVIAMVVTAVVPAILM